MNKGYILYALFFIARVIIMSVVLHKYGLKAWGLAMMNTLLTVITPEDFA